MEDRNYNIVIATRNMVPPLIRLSKLLLKLDNDAIYNEEFLCEHGLRSSVVKGNVVVALSGKEICGMLRFYPNKRIAQTSIYQFAVANTHRGHGLVRKMLDFIQEKYKGAIVCKCPSRSRFNDYYAKTGWVKTANNDIICWEWRRGI
jgi:hypothetical protein